MDEVYNTLYAIDHLNKYEVYVTGATYPMISRKVTAIKSYSNLKLDLALRKLFLSTTCYYVNTANILHLNLTNAKHI